MRVRPCAFSAWKIGTATAHSVRRWVKLLSCRCCACGYLDAARGAQLGSAWPLLAELRKHLSTLAILLPHQSVFRLDRDGKKLSGWYSKVFVECAISIGRRRGVRARAGRRRFGSGGSGSGSHRLPGLFFLRPLSWVRDEPVFTSAHAKHSLRLRQHEKSLPLINYPSFFTLATAGP